MLPSVVVSSSSSSSLALLLFIIVSPWTTVLGRKSSGSVNIDPTIYGMSLQRDWLSGAASTVAMKYEGCVWGYAGDRENMGCMADESGDGTTYWYMMANCRRAQVAYSVYASSGSTSCNKRDFKETFVTTNGVAEFAYTMGTYGYNSPISSSDVSSLPMCEYDGNGYYYGVGCSSSGTFTIDRFSDAYCTQYYDTYDKLSNLNSALKSLSKCHYIYSTRTDEDPSYSLANYLIQESTSCSSAENSLCTTSEFVANSGSYASKQKTSNTTSKRSNLSKLTDKLKYTLGTAMLCGSAIMFVGILFTNRKKRRAMMHGKLKAKSDAAKTKSRSKSRSSSQKKRSSSKKKTSSSSSGAAREGGIFA